MKLRRIVQRRWASSWKDMTMSYAREKIAILIHGHKLCLPCHTLSYCSAAIKKGVSFECVDLTWCHLVRKGHFLQHVMTLTQVWRWYRTQASSFEHVWWTIYFVLFCLCGLFKDVVCHVVFQAQNKLRWTRAVSIVAARCHPFRPLLCRQPYLQLPPCQGITGIHTKGE